MKRPPEYSNPNRWMQFFPGVSHNIHMERPELVHHSVDNYLRRRGIAPSAGKLAAELQEAK